MSRLAILLLTVALSGTSAVAAHAADATTPPPAAAADKPTKTASGLEYVDTKVGAGPAVKSGDTVTLKYVIAIGERKIEASRPDTPMKFTVGAEGQALKGLDEGVRGMKAGGQRKLTIPPDLGYGAEAVPKVPANSTLLIDVELLELK